jgi:hypothetical protein
VSFSRHSCTASCAPACSAANNRNKTKPPTLSVHPFSVHPFSVHPFSVHPFANSNRQCSLNAALCFFRARLYVLLLLYPRCLGAGLHPEGAELGSHLTPRWRKGDSNSPSHPERERSEERHMGSRTLPVSESRPPEKRNRSAGVSARHRPRRESTPENRAGQRQKRYR